MFKTVLSNLFNESLRYNSLFGKWNTNSLLRLTGIHTMINTQTKPKLLIISGPSGSGKSTLIQKLFGEFPDKFGFSVSHTSRAPRPGEINGIHYHFLTKEKIQKAIDEGEFIESAVYTNHLCGTSKTAVEKVLNEGKICVLDIDTQGVRQMKSKPDLESIFVFIKPPSLEVLEKRLRDRKTETEENIQRRLKVAEAELDYGIICRTPFAFMSNSSIRKIHWFENYFKSYASPTGETQKTVLLRILFFFACII